MDMDSSGSDRAASSNQDIAILGGSGFIGSRMAARMTEQNLPFRIGDLKQSAAFSDRWMACDVRKSETLLETLRGATAIVNLAAEHRDDVRPLSRYQETNVLGASQVCLAARHLGIQKIVFTSSVAVYGFHSGPMEECGPYAPFNEYGKTKLEAERVYQDWAKEDSARTLVIVRPTVVFGEGNRANVYNLLKQIASGRFLMTGPGTNVKSMAYVENVAAFLIHSLSFGPGVHFFNYTDGPDMTTRELVDFVKRCLGRNGRVPRMPKTVALAGGYFFDALSRLTGQTFPVSAVRVRKFCENTQVSAKRVAQTKFIPPSSLGEGLARTIHFEFPPSG